MQISSQNQGHPYRWVSARGGLSRLGTNCQALSALYLRLAAAPFLPLHSQSPISAITVFPFFPSRHRPLETTSPIRCNCAPLTLGARVHSFEPPSLILPTQVFGLPQTCSANCTLFVRIDRLSPFHSGFASIHASFCEFRHSFSIPHLSEHSSPGDITRITTCSTDHRRRQDTTPLSGQHLFPIRFIPATLLDHIHHHVATVSCRAAGVVRLCRQCCRAGHHRLLPHE